MPGGRRGHTCEHASWLLHPVWRRRRMQGTGRRRGDCDGATAADRVRRRLLPRDGPAQRPPARLPRRRRLRALARNLARPRETLRVSLRAFCRTPNRFHPYIPTPEANVSRFTPCAGAWRGWSGPFAPGKGAMMLVRRCDPEVPDVRASQDHGSPSLQSGGQLGGLHTPSQGHPGRHHQRGRSGRHHGDPSVCSTRAIGVSYRAWQRSRC